MVSSSTVNNLVSFLFLYSFSVVSLFTKIIIFYSEDGYVVFYFSGETVLVSAQSPSLCALALLPGRAGCACSIYLFIQLPAGVKPPQQVRHLTYGSAPFELNPIIHLCKIAQLPKCVQDQGPSLQTGAPEQYPSRCAAQPCAPIPSNCMGHFQCCAPLSQPLWEDWGS